MAECRRVCAFWLLLIFLFTGNFENCDAVTPKRNKFTIGHLNICGLLGKLDLLTLFIEKHNFDIFGVTESLLNENIPTSLLNIKGYSFEKKIVGRKIKSSSQNKEIKIVGDANSNYLDKKKPINHSKNLCH